MAKLFREKRGLQQSDWAISVGIFVLYLVIFFIAIKPLITPPTKVDSLLSRAEDNFIDNTTVVVDRVPILIRQETDFAYEPIIADIPYDWDPDNMAVSEGYFIFEAGKLLFLANTSDTREFTVSHSSDIHEVDPEMGIVSSATQADVEDFKVEFSDGVPSRYTYKDDVRIESLNFYLDSDAFERYSRYQDHTTLARYTATGILNHSTYVFAKNPRSYTYLESLDYQPHNVSWVLDLYNYTEYYVDISSFGDIVYTTERCSDFETDFIDLYDSNTGMALFFNSEVELELCNNVSELWLNIEGELNESQEVSYTILFHTGDYEDIIEYPVRPVLGFRQEIESTSYNAVSMLAAINYTDLKARWAFPYNHDFKILFTSEDYNETIGAEPPLVDVYAKHLRLFNYDGVDFEEVNAVISVWGGS